MFGANGAMKRTAPIMIWKIRVFLFGFLMHVPAVSLPVSMHRAHIAAIYSIPILPFLKRRTSPLEKPFIIIRGIPLKSISMSWYAKLSIWVNISLNELSEAREPIPPICCISFI